MKILNKSGMRIILLLLLITAISGCREEATPSKIGMSGAAVRYNGTHGYAFGFTNGQWQSAKLWIIEDNTWTQVAEGSGHYMPGNWHDIVVSANGTNFLGYIDGSLEINYTNLLFPENNGTGYISSWSNAEFDEFEEYNYSKDTLTNITNFLRNDGQTTFTIQINTSQFDIGRQDLIVALKDYIDMYSNESYLLNPGALATFIRVFNESNLTQGYLKLNTSEGENDNYTIIFPMDSPESNITEVNLSDPPKGCTTTFLSTGTTTTTNMSDYIVMSCTPPEYWDPNAMLECDLEAETTSNETTYSMEKDNYSPGEQFSICVNREGEKLVETAEEACYDECYATCYTVEQTEYQQRLFTINLDESWYDYWNYWGYGSSLGMCRSTPMSSCCATATTQVAASATCTTYGSAYEPLWCWPSWSFCCPGKTQHTCPAGSFGWIRYSANGGTGGNTKSCGPYQTDFTAEPEWDHNLITNIGEPCNKGWTFNCDVERKWRYQDDLPLEYYFAKDVGTDDYNVYHKGGKEQALGYTVGNAGCIVATLTLVPPNYQTIVNHCTQNCDTDCRDEAPTTYTQQCGYNITDIIYIKQNSTGNIVDRRPLDGMGTSCTNMPAPLEPGLYDIYRETEFLFQINVTDEDSLRLFLNETEMFMLDEDTRQIEANLSNKNIGGTFNLTITGAPEFVSMQSQATMDVDDSVLFNLNISNVTGINDSKVWTNIIVEANDGINKVNASFDLIITETFNSVVNYSTIAAKGVEIEKQSGLSVVFPQFNKFKFREKINFKKYNRRIASLTGKFELGHMDLYNISMDSNLAGTKVFIDLTSINILTANIKDTHELFLNKISGFKGVYICPNAISLTEVYDGCPDQVNFTGNDIKQAIAKNINGAIVSVALINEEYYEIRGLTGTGAGTSGLISDLAIWSEIDAGYPYGGQTKYVNDTIKFFANYTTSAGASIYPADCTIKFNNTIVTNAMTYNSSGFYEYTNTFTEPGNYSYNITCYNTSYDLLSAIGDLNLEIYESNANLIIADDGPKLTGQLVNFTANYTNVTSGEFITGASCNITLSTGTYEMEEGNLYWYNQSFGVAGTYEYNITCEKTGFDRINATDNVTINEITGAQITTVYPNSTGGESYEDTEIIQVSIAEPNNQVFRITYTNTSAATVKWYIEGEEQITEENNTQITWIGNYTQEGDYIILVNVTSIDGDDWQYWNLTVSNTQIPPLYEEYRYTNGTTNLLGENDYNVVNDMVLANSYGSLNWSNVWVSSIDVEAEDYDTNIEIGDRFVYLNAAGLKSSINQTTKVTLLNVDCDVEKAIFYSTSSSTRTGIITEETLCPGTICTDFNCTGTTLTFFVDHWTGYASGENANLTITNDGPAQTNEQVNFTADYENKTSGQFITGASCNITFTDGTYPMIETASIYYYNRSFSSADTYNYDVTCNEVDFSKLTANDNVLISSSNSLLTIFDDGPKDLDETATFTANYSNTTSTISSVGSGIISCIGSSTIKIFSSTFGFCSVIINKENSNTNVNTKGIVLFMSFLSL